MHLFTPTPLRSYQAAWRDYRRRSALVAVAITTLATAVLTSHAALLAAVGLGAAAAFIYWTFWTCPRCEQWFFADLLAVDYFSPECIHCRLPKWAGDDSRG